MESYKVPFVLDTIKNNAKSDLSFSIESVGISTEPLILSLRAGQQITGLGLSFGPQEYKEVYVPKGYLITDLGSHTVFTTLKVLLDYVENPLIDIPYEYNHRSLTLPYLYYWSLYCNNKYIQAFSSKEHERKCYVLTINNECNINVEECTL